MIGLGAFLRRKRCLAHLCRQSFLRGAVPRRSGHPLAPARCEKCSFRGAKTHRRQASEVGPNARRPVGRNAARSEGLDPVRRPSIQHQGLTSNIRTEFPG